MPPKSLWPIRPKPIEGEALSSWLSRIAGGFGFSLREFYELHLPKIANHGPDIDQIADGEFFEVLAHSVGVPIEDARQTGYVADEGKIFCRQTSRSPEWIAPLMYRGRGNYYPSLPFCPTCLATDKVPYYRKRWRYAFLPVCPNHGLMTNKCPRCGHFYGYIGQDNSRLSNVPSGAIAVCRRCEQRFPASTIPGLDDALLASVVGVQEKIQAALDAGWIEIGDYGPLHTCLYLRGLHDLVSILLHPRHGTETTEWVGIESGIPVANPVRSEWQGSLESRSTATRAMLIPLATWLAQEWPDRLVALIKSLNLRVSNVLPAARKRPAWMVLPAIEALFPPVEDRSESEYNSARTALARKLNWSPYKAQIVRFMETGEIPAIRRRYSLTTVEGEPLSLNEHYWSKDALFSTKEKEEDTYKERQRQLYLQDNHASIFEPSAEDMDDASDRLTALRQWMRKNRAKPTSG